MTPEENEGQDAAKSMKLFDACPYTFEACDFDEGRFDRAKLNAWWKGFSEHYKATIGFIPNAKHPPDGYRLNPSPNTSMTGGTSGPS